MTDAEKSSICASGTAMERYLLSGTEAALSDSQIDQLPIGPLNWRKYGNTAEDPRPMLWSDQSFAGWYWWRVSLYRERRQIPLTLPDVGRLLGAIKLRGRTMARADFHRLIGLMVKHFELIQFLMGSAGQTVALNEASIAHSLIWNTTCNLAQMTEEQLEEQYRRLRVAMGLEADRPKRIAA
ncbi:MAG: hypothetical protein QM770_10855 [Tepidisphaeraceae bacterium]